jgi:hypothetical protein
MYVQVQDVGKKLLKKTYLSLMHFEVEVQLQLFFTSELEGHEWLGLPRRKGPRYPQIAAAAAAQLLTSAHPICT